MLPVILKIVKSKITRILFSVAMIWWAFSKVNISELVKELGNINWLWIVLILFYLGLTMLIGGFRWALITLPKVGIRDILIFTKSTYLGGFYSLFFPSAVGGDLLKWIPLLKQYPNLSKQKLATSVVVDRIIGFTCFSVVAFISLICGKLLKYSFPNFIFWLFLIINIGVVVFYLVVYFIDVDNLVNKLPWGKKIEGIISIFQKENKNRVFKSFLLSLITEPIWISTSYFFALLVGAPINLIQIFIFIPIISLTLILPISFAGFGARENLYLFFFTPLGVDSEKLLLMSTVGGIVGIINSLIGGIFLIF